MGLVIRELKISVGRRHPKLLLDRVNLDVEKNEFACLLGPSGAGKSTLLKAIAGILLQDSGTIDFDGHAIDVLPVHRRRVGFVFQDMRLFPNMNVEENVGFPCKMAKVPKREYKEWVSQLLSSVQLDGFGSREIYSLSGGQQQRVALARALAGTPQLLLLDEPFSGLDENLRDEMRSLVLRLHREYDLTTVLVTHDAIEALEMSDSITYISNGRIIQKGSPRELYEHPLTSEIAGCFGECSVLSGEVRQGVFRRSDLGLPADGCSDGPACAVVRYDAVSIKSGECSSLPLRCFVYRGGEHLLRLDVAGETLTVPVRGEVEETPGDTLGVHIEPAGCFVYPLAAEASIEDSQPATGHPTAKMQV